MLAVECGGADGSPLAGAVFGIYDDRGALIAKAESEENGQAVFYGLARGTYSIEELAAPEGYEKTDKKRALQLILAAMPCYNRNLKGLI